MVLRVGRDSHGFSRNNPATASGSANSLTGASRWRFKPIDWLRFRSGAKCAYRMVIAREAAPDRHRSLAAGATERRTLEARCRASNRDRRQDALGEKDRANDSVAAAARVRDAARGGL